MASSRKVRINTFIILFVVAFILLWFSDVIPIKIAELVAVNYISSQEDGEEYTIINSDYSNAHDCYFVYFINTDNSEQRNIGIYFRFLPYDIYYDSKYPG